MRKVDAFKRATLGTAMAAVIAASLGAGLPAPALAQRGSAVAPSEDLAIGVGAGRLIRLDSTISDIFVADPLIADVQVKSTDSIYIFGRKRGETTVYATNKAGRVVYSANVQIGRNIGNIDEMLKLAMPDAQITTTPMNGLILLTGTVGTPSDVEEASRLVKAFVGKGINVLSRLKTAVPLQVMLKVKIAEVNRTLAKDIGLNLLTRDTDGPFGNGFLFGIGRGREVGSIKDVVSKTLTDPITGNPAVVGTDFTFTNPAGPTALNFAGNLLGIDIAGALDLAENSGLVTTLAEPTLTALSGETASFLAGGEFPVAFSDGINGVGIEFKEYGVSLAFSPTVLEGGRISMRVRPEVSELTSEGAIRLNGFEIPALTTRRAETTVELGSGQSFMLGGLLRNTANNAIEKAPWLGDIPVLGSLFRSTSFRRNETELMIVVTPYLVKPVSAGQIALPTDGFRVPNEVQRVLLDQRHDSRTGEQRPGPVAGPPRPVAVVPGGSAAASAPAGVQQAKRSNAPAPGFNF